MPSWNVHTAHVQRLLREGRPSDYGIRDVNAFLFGNFVPDIYLGYMVKEPSGILPYRLTHFADPGHIPIPRAQEFWDTYVEPTLPVPDNVPLGQAQLTVEEGVAISRAGGSFVIPPAPERHDALVAKLTSPDYRASDMTLGAWAHLLCDNTYNAATHAWLHRYNVPTGERTRIRKQGDFDKFGRTLPVTLTCEATDELYAQAAAFPQYEIHAVDVPRALDVSNGIVADNQVRHIVGSPEYSLFTEEFFLEVFEHACELMVAQLRAYAVRLAEKGLA